VKQGFFDWVIASVSLAVCILTAVYWREEILLTIASGILAILFFIWGFVRQFRQTDQCSKNHKNNHGQPNGYLSRGDNPRNTQGKIRQLILLNEHNQEMKSWDIFGRTALVIGRDEGENEVDIDLSDVTYAGFIDVEHAVLNYAGDYWYIEDLHSKNGVKVQKRGDTRAYKLATDKPCLLEAGDIIYIARTKMSIR